MKKGLIKASAANLRLPFGDPGSVTEKLLQYIWQFQYFNSSQLKTVCGEPLEIMHAGTLNHNQGPDFVNARIRIGAAVFAGSVELHLKTSQWDRHGHQDDPNYKNVVLHVVLQDDEACNTQRFPVLELQSRIPGILLQRYTGLMEADSFIACAGSIAGVKEITWAGWKERLLAERLERKAGVVAAYLEKNNLHWQESFWWMLARNFGMRVNGEAFESIAQSLPLTLLARHKPQIQQVEALLMGQGGLLNKTFTESYPNMLRREYEFLKRKYHLDPVELPLHFLRMRPCNFPTVRLAQLAMLVHHSAHLFSTILEAAKVQEASRLFEQTANDYWHYHYRFDEPSVFQKKTVGKGMAAHLVINTAIPFLFAYSRHHREERYRLKALDWLEELPAEQNAVTKGYTALGVLQRTAYDSQALLELKTNYCNARQCLQCAVGNELLKRCE